MMATGVRIGEAHALYWKDVDLEAATVTINYTVGLAKGEGLVRKSTKTSAGERVLPLPSRAAERLRTTARRSSGRRPPGCESRISQLRRRTSRPVELTSGAP